MTGRIIIPFDTGAGSQTLNYEFGNLALDSADWMRVSFELTKALTDAGDTVNGYIASRGPSGIWEDRIAFDQFLGTASVSGSAPEVRYATLQQAGTLSDAEEQGEPSGSAGASRLTTGTVKNGPFPGQYHDANGVRGASWRAQIVVVDADNDGDYEGNFKVEFNEA